MDPDYEKPTFNCDRAKRERYIKAKYVSKLFCDLPTEVDRTSLAQVINQNYLQLN